MELPIFLIGYMGAGKTTVGRLLAAKLGWHFADMDDAFREINGMTTGAFIREHGIEDFRKAERDCAEQLAELPIRHVIYATGGGFPCWEDNMDCLSEWGTTIYLRWPVEKLVKRLIISGTENRPVLTQGMAEMVGDTVEERMTSFVTMQLQVREDFYEQADYIQDAPETLDVLNDEEIAEELYQLILDEMQPRRR